MAKMKTMKEALLDADKDPKNKEHIEAEADKLRSFIERIENLEGEKRAISTDISEVYKEAKKKGFDTKAMRAIVKIRSQDPAERETLEYFIEAYKVQLGLD